MDQLTILQSFFSFFLFNFICTNSSGKENLTWLSRNAEEMHGKIFRNFSFPCWKPLKSIYQSYLRLLGPSSEERKKSTIQVLFGLHHLACAEMQNSFKLTPVVRCFYAKSSPVHNPTNTKSHFRLSCLMYNRKSLSLYHITLPWMASETWDYFYESWQNNIRWSIPTLSTWNE